MPSIPFPTLTPAFYAGLSNSTSRNETAVDPHTYDDNNTTVGNSTTNNSDSSYVGPDPQPSIRIGFVILGILIAVILAVIFYFNVQHWCRIRVKARAKKAKELSVVENASSILPPYTQAVSGLTSIPPRSSSRHPRTVPPLYAIPLPTRSSHPKPSDPAPRPPLPWAQSTPVDSSPLTPIIREPSPADQQEHNDTTRERVSAWRQALPADDSRRVSRSRATTQSSQGTEVVGDARANVQSMVTRRVMIHTPSVSGSNIGAQRS